MINKRILTGLIVLAAGLIVLNLTRFAVRPVEASALQPCSTVETLTTTPNDDLNPRWSPDGKQIAFVGHHQGNPEIYLLNVATHALTNLSHSPGDDFNPVWSPDGQNIAFLRREQPQWKTVLQLMLVEVETGDTLAITSPNQGEFRNSIEWVQWSADSQSIIFKGFTAYFSYDIATHELREVLPFTPKSIYYLFPAPDTHQAVTRLNNGSDNNIHLLYTSDLFDTSEVSQESFFSGEVWSGSWSPDSTRFAFSTSPYPAPNELHVYDLQTRLLHEIDPIENTGIGNLIWSLDGRLAWTTSSPTQDGLPMTLSLINGSYTEPHQLLQLHMPFTLANWSPTRDHLAFYSYAGVYVLDVPTGNYRDFIQGLGMVKKVVWSPDGNYVAASIFEQWGVLNQVAVADIRDGSLCVYENNYIFSDPHWSPTGNRLLFSSGMNGNSNLILLTLPD